MSKRYSKKFKAFDDALSLQHKYIYDNILKKRTELTSEEIIKICKLKDTLWRFGSQNQKNGLKKINFVSFVIKL